MSTASMIKSTVAPAARNATVQSSPNALKLSAKPAAKVFARRQMVVTNAVSTGPSKLAFVEQAPADPILGVSEAFKACTSPDKLNLGVGAYRTEELQPYVLEVVKKAEKTLVDKMENKEYLPIDGLADFKKCTMELLLGADSAAVKEGRAVAVQSLSGTGSLRVGAAFLNRYLTGKTVYLSNPTWGNHKNIFADAGCEWKHYRYFDQATVGLDFAGMMADIEAAEEGSIFVLHGCAHNPTGVDPTPEQWKEIALAMQKKKHLTFFDVAYQGFASGSLEEDAFAPRLFADMGLEMFVSQSYSKNLGLYGERIGAINAVLSDKESAGKVLSQLKRIARAMYSNPPVHGARLVAEVVGNEAMFDEWKAEMEMMAGRIKTVRELLYGHLTEKMPEKDFSFVTRQIGMFSYTGLNQDQVANMTNKWHVYMTKDGRISLAGLSASKAEYLADAMVDSYKNH